MFASIMMILLSLSQANASVGFSNGNELNATAIEGQVSVTCEGFNGNGQALYTCRDVVLDPEAYDYFVGPVHASANRVELRAFHADGSNDMTVEAYDGAAGKTYDKINLWISTLFQTPLLKRGTNRVSYSIYSDLSMKEFAKGEINVNIARGTPRKCAPLSYNSTDLNDCHAQYSVCQRYFQELKHCR